MKVLWTRRALASLQHETTYIRNENPKAADKAGLKIRHYAETLAQHPNLGRPGRIERTQELIHPTLPFIITYRVQSESVEILFIRHASRQWPRC